MFLLRSLRVNRSRCHFEKDYHKKRQAFCAFFTLKRISLSSSNLSTMTKEKKCWMHQRPLNKPSLTSKLVKTMECGWCCLVYRKTHERTAYISVLVKTWLRFVIKNTWEWQCSVFCTTSRECNMEEDCLNYE